MVGKWEMENGVIVKRGTLWCGGIHFLGAESSVLSSVDSAGGTSIFTERYTTVSSQT